MVCNACLRMARLRRPNFMRCSWVASRSVKESLPSDWIKRIEQIADAGARKLWVNLRAADMDSQQHYMRILGEQIMSRFV